MHTFRCGVVAALVSCVACATTTRGVSVDEVEGAVPIVIESEGPEQDVVAEISRTSTRRREGIWIIFREEVERRRLCTTPCTLYAAPGTHARLWIEADETKRGMIRFHVPSTGARVRVSAATREGRAWASTLPLAVGIGTTGVAFAVLVGAHAIDSREVAAVGLGGVVLGLGVAGAGLVGGALQGPRRELLSLEDPAVPVDEPYVPLVPGDAIDFLELGVSHSGDPQHAFGGYGRTLTAPSAAYGFATPTWTGELRGSAAPLAAEAAAYGGASFASNVWFGDDVRPPRLDDLLNPGAVAGVREHGQMHFAWNAFSRGAHRVGVGGHAYVFSTAAPPILPTDVPAHLLGVGPVATYAFVHERFIATTSLAAGGAAASPASLGGYGRLEGSVRWRIRDHVGVYGRASLLSQAGPSGLHVPVTAELGVSLLDVVLD